MYRFQNIMNAMGILMYLITLLSTRLQATPIRYGTLPQLVIQDLTEICQDFKKLVEMDGNCNLEQIISLPSRGQHTVETMTWSSIRDVVKHLQKYQTELKNERSQESSKNWAQEIKRALKAIRKIQNKIEQQEHMREAESPDLPCQYQELEIIFRDLIWQLTHVSIHIHEDQFEEPYSPPEECSWIYGNQ